MPTPAEERAQVREEARLERSSLLGQIIDIQGALQIDNPISITPYEQKSAAVADVLTAARWIVDQPEDDEPSEAVGNLRTAVEAFDAEPPEFDERSTPVAVLSLDGLRRLQSLLSELQQLRDQQSGGEEGNGQVE